MGLLFFRDNKLQIKISNVPKSQYRKSALLMFVVKNKTKK